MQFYPGKVLLRFFIKTAEEVLGQLWLMIKQVPVFMSLYCMQEFKDLRKTQGPCQGVQTMQHLKHCITFLPIRDTKHLHSIAHRWAKPYVFLFQ